jgi:hypothetical protein
MPAWNFDQNGVYIFDFSPKRDDFSEVKVGAAWSLDPVHALLGNEFSCCFADAASHAALMTANLTPPVDANWLFSAPFEFRAGITYEAGLKYKATTPVTGMPPRLTLRLGEGQTPADQNQKLLEFTISNTSMDVLHSTFTVPKDGVYHFSLEGQPGDGSVALLRNSAGVAGSIAGF